MPIIWNKQVPRWEGETIEPPESKKDVGYIAGDNPPASWENWLRKGTYEALDETRDVIEGIDSQLAQLAVQKDESKTTTFNPDGSITETTTKSGITVRSKTTSFPSSTTIIEATVENGVTTTKTITFNLDGTITEGVI